MRNRPNIESLIAERQGKGQLKSLTLVRTHDGKMYQAGLDYGLGSYAVHVDPDPLVALAWVLASELELRMDIARQARDDRDRVTVADLQMSCGKPRTMKKTHIPKVNATQRVEPVRDGLEDLLG